MTTGEIIRAKREDLGLSQLMLSEAVGVSRPMIAQIERGTKAVTLPVGKRIAATLGCTIDELAG